MIWTMEQVAAVRRRHAKIRFREDDINEFAVARMTEELTTVLCDDIREIVGADATVRYADLDFRRLDVTTDAFAEPQLRARWIGQEQMYFSDGPDREDKVYVVPARVIGERRMEMTEGAVFGLDDFRTSETSRWELVMEGWNDKLAAWRFVRGRRLS